MEDKVMKISTKWWMAVPLAVGLIVAACGDDGDAATPDPTDVPEATDVPVAATEAPVDLATEEPAGGAAAAATAVIVFGDEEIAIDRLLCYFEEQPRAGLGGVYTHTAQGSGTTAAGEPIIIDLSRARDEDGTVGDDILVDIGEPGSEEAIGLRAVGAEGLIQFGESSVAAADVELTDFESDPVMLSFDLACG
jgi:hypothetical protein